MSDYLTRTLLRTVNQLLVLFGGIFLLAFLLCFAASQIRGTGESAFGRGYYYFVMPGVVCHETGHAVGCLLTGTEIIHYQPFRPQGRELGHVVFRRKGGNPVWRIAECVIAAGPLWFGCLVIALLTKLFGRHCRRKRFDDYFPLDLFPATHIYWFGVTKAAGSMLREVVSIWKWKSSLDILYLYLVFCIVSEMGLSDADFSGVWMGLLCLCGTFLALNIIPAVGMKVSGWTLMACKRLFAIHVTMMFVLIVEVLFLFITWPIRFLLR